MCCDTKRKIADGLLVVWAEKPLKKITVQDIMMQENMKRQSFYYHFQDIYEVVEWMFQVNFVEKLSYREDENFENWVARAVEIVQDNRFFYRKMLESVERETLMKMLAPVVYQQVEARFEIVAQSENPLVQQFVVRSMCHFILDSLQSCKRMDKEQIMAASKSVVEILNLH